MAFLENGSPVATKLGPIATLNTSLDGKAAVTQVFDITSTTRFWLALSSSAAGTYNILTNTGTATLYRYDTSNNLESELSINSTSTNYVFSQNYNRIEVVTSGSLELSVTRIPAKITAAGGTMSLQSLGTGNYAGDGTGTAGNYTPGQYAHVIVIGAGGGNGGSGLGPNNFWNSGGSGGSGGVQFTSNAIALTGTYALTAGTAALSGNNNSNNWGGNGNPAVGTSTGSTGFGYTTNAGTNGNAGGSSANPGNPGTAGGPVTYPQNTGIYKPATSAKTGYGGGGQDGRILVLKWTP